MPIFFHEYFYKMKLNEFIREILKPRSFVFHSTIFLIYKLTWNSLKQFLSFVRQSCITFFTVSANS